MATLEAPVRPRTSLHSGPFVTEPFFDFRNEENARRMRSAIAKVRAQLGREYDLVIGGKRVKTTDKIKSLNPWLIGFRQLPLRASSFCHFHSPTPERKKSSIAIAAIDDWLMRW